MSFLLVSILSRDGSRSKGVIRARVAVSSRFVHDCTGRLVSRDVLLLFTVVAQAYKVDVEVTGGASRGCTAILRCIIPSYVKDLVRVVSWLHEPSSYIYPSLQGGK